MSQYNERELLILKLGEIRYAVMSAVIGGVQAISLEDLQRFQEQKRLQVLGDYENDVFHTIEALDTKIAKELFND